MTVSADWFGTLLDDPATTRRWLGGLGLRDAERGARELRDLADRALDPAVVSQLAFHLDALLPRCPDPGMALSNLERFISACPDPRASLRLLAQHPRTTE